MNETIGVITVIITIIICSFYLKDTVKGKITPHSFSWIIWFLISVVIFLAQISDNAGPGAWMTGTACIFGFLITISSIKNGFKNITKWDSAIFILSLLSIPLWIVTKNAMVSVILLTITNTLAYFPTYRKSFTKPYEEPVYLYGLNFFRHGLSIFALANFSIITALAPIGLIINNGALALFLLYRRHKMKKTSKTGASLRG